MTFKRIATKGDKVLFTKENLSLIGEVTTVRMNRIVVRISDEDVDRIKAETSFVDVSHGQYKIVIM